MTDASIIDTHYASPSDRDSSPTTSEANTRALLRPLDFVIALTGLALLFFTLFVYAVTEWRYLGTDVDDVSPLGWIAPFAAGGLCLLSTAITVAIRTALTARTR